MVAENQMARDSFLDDDTIEYCMSLILKSGDGGANYTAFQFGNKLWNDKPSLIWAWHLGDDNVAIAVRSKHESIPDLVKTAIGATQCLKGKSKAPHRKKKKHNPK
mmetsp:Transcript_14402/g.16355  ORF Transcript_14402/g.16355 Transcript_14402/m.16355 type:complete len:105 (+) Transcript_14402:96-410(+)